MLIRENVVYLRDPLQGKHMIYMSLNERIHHAPTPSKEDPKILFRFTLDQMTIVSFIFCQTQLQTGLKVVLMLYNFYAPH